MNRKGYIWIRVYTLVLFIITALLYISTIESGSTVALTAKNAPYKIEQLEEMEISLPIIMYHSTFKKGNGKFCITPNQLERDLVYLRENGFHTITVADLLMFQNGEKNLPAKCVMLTFDDGYTNNYFYAYPLFQKYKMKCVMSVIGCQIDKNYIKDDVSAPSYAHMDYEQIKEVHQSGLVEIQNHTYNMHNTIGRKGLSKLKGETAHEYEKKLTADLTMLNEKLKNRSGITPSAVAYPFGAYSKETVGILKKLGFKASFTCREGINTITRSSSLFNLNRYNRPHGKSSADFFQKIMLHDDADVSKEGSNNAKDEK